MIFKSNMLIKTVKLVSSILILFGIFVQLQAFTTELDIIGDGSAGPYPLGRFFLDSSSIKAQFTDTSLGEIPPFIYIASQNGILFSEPIDSGVVIRVLYQLQYYGLNKMYQLYKEKYYNLADTTLSKELQKTEFSSPFASENITISGYKSVGVSVGNLGQMSVEQALEVKVFGKINEDTELSANLSDQETSLQGDTREIGEIDRMFVTLANPRYMITAGDMLVAMPYGDIYQSQKKIKGLSTSYTGKKLGLSSAIAITGGKHKVQNIEGRLGFQGPYFLTGNGEADIITPIVGTVKILVNGKQLREGVDHDYIVDYELATIRFTPAYSITDNSLIQVYYEYKAFDYQRIFLGNDIGFSNKDSTIFGGGFVWLETDNKENAIALNLDDTVITMLKESGDSMPLVTTGKKIHKNDVPKQNNTSRLYKSKTVGLHSYYVYSPFDPLLADSVEGFYLVWFTEVAPGNGLYRKFDTTDAELEAIMDSAAFELTKKNDRPDDPRGPIYVYVGPGKGNFTDLAPAPAPKRNTLGELKFSFKPRDWFGVTINLAGEEEDLNLFSSKDDKDNTASAVKSSWQLGRQIFEEKCLWLQGSHLFSSSRFSHDIINPYTCQNQWNRELASLADQELHIWQVTNGATFLPSFSAQLSYGQLITNKSIQTHRFTYGAKNAVKNNLTVNYAGAFIKHLETKDIEKLHKDSIQANLTLENFHYRFRYDDEWQISDLQDNKGKIGAGVELDYLPLAITESFYYSQSRKGGQSLFTPWQAASYDTGSTFIWEQKTSHNPRSTWKYSASTSYHRQNKKLPDKTKKTTSVLLITLMNDIASVKAGFSTHQEYRLNSEKASLFEPVYILVGPNKGTHGYDSATNQYIPNKSPKNYKFADVQEIFDSTGTDRIRKSTFKTDYYFKPYFKKIKGLLADLTWHGTFFIEEHINDRQSQSLRSWIPGYNSLSKKEDKSITFADIFYMQGISWRPATELGLNGEFSFRPFLKKNHSYDEKGWEIKASIDKDWKKFKLGSEAGMQTLNRNIRFLKQQKTIIKDRNITLQQRYYMIPSLSMFAKETAGYADKTSYTGNAKGPFFRLQPGFTFQLFKKGWAELSYTWSQVGIEKHIEYPMAQGFSEGTSHIIDFIIDINIGEHFTIGGTYRGNSGNKFGPVKMLHTLSLEVKAFL